MVENLFVASIFDVASAIWGHKFVLSNGGVRSLPRVVIASLLLAKVLLLARLAVVNVSVE